MPSSRLSYLLQRLGRNLLPQGLAAWGRRRFGGIPGGESDAPQIFADHYVETLAREGESFVGREVLVFGQGPSYGFACALLAAGVRHCFLFDPYARPDDRLNLRWLERYGDYLRQTPRGVRPDERWMTELAPASVAEATRLPRVDVVVSTSVFEHLRQVDRWTAKLAGATAPGGCQVHMIDLRDHFFDMPFEMLCYADAVWNRWLNPRQHLNRWRLAGYEEVFRRHFGEVKVELLERDEEAFAVARPRIRPEFLSGDPVVDSVTEIEVFARRPIGAAPVR